MANDSRRVQKPNDTTLDSIDLQSATGEDFVARYNALYRAYLGKPWKKRAEA